MPIYEYTCRHCQTRFEELVLSAQETIACPACEGSEVERQLSVFSAPGNRAKERAGAGGCGCTPATCGCH